MFTSLRIRGRAGVVLAAGALVAGPATAACGVSAENGDGSTAKTIIAAALNNGYANLAVEPGLGKQFGVTIQQVQAPSGGSSAQMAALLSGTVDFAVMGDNAAVDAIAQGADARIIAGILPLLDTLTISNAAAKRVGITADAPAQEKLRSLKGLKVVAPRPGTAGLATFEALLRGAGLDPGADLEIVPISDNAAIPAGLRQGTYDASFASLGAGEVAIASGDAISLGSIAEGDFPQLKGYFGNVLVVSKGLLEDNPQLVTDVRNTFIAARKAVLEDPKAADRLYKATFSNMDRAVYDKAWVHVKAATRSVDPDLTYPKASWDKFVELFDGTGKVDYSSLAYENLVAEVARG